MKKPFEKSPPPTSYAEGPRLSRALSALPKSDQERFLEGYLSHLAAPRYASVQRRGARICLCLEGSSEEETYDFSTVLNAQRCLTALTDCLRANRSQVKVLMPTEALPKAKK